MHTIMAAADAVKGAIVFKKCATCHVSEKGAPNKVGPNLWGILGAKTASRDGFAYSAAMAGRGAEGKTWGYEDLYRYLYSPKKYVPGTKMAFAGIKDDKERADVIAYLSKNADTQVPLP
ncbi:MAG: cytochrome c family protein [Proteobacteria bacterium]|nr:cytochrome c family protein [Pseudomonadota bacterium]